MRTARLGTWSPLPILATALGLAAMAGCGGSGTTVDCTPACPARWHCTEVGCVPDDGTALLDLSVALDQKADCPVMCGGATPYCGPSLTCVPCLQDSHCPTGNVCKPVGAGTACLPGCADDARCGGGSAKCCQGTCVDTAKDVANCGACGTACLANHAGDSCQGGQCVVGTCEAGWGDCNADSKDGCEVYLRSDAANCGACGTACAPAHGAGACAHVCYISGCDYGWDDCNADPADGCEVPTATDPKNCGACANFCVAAPHAQVGCQVGTCQLTSCNAGFGDCNGVYNDGCEVTLSSDARNCGACGTVCGQGLVCVLGQCTCPPCAFPNAKAGCMGLKCVIASCINGWADCDGQSQNGCERNIGTDVSNCGGCGMACAQGLVCANGACTCPQCNIPNARTKCINNVCVLDQCLPNWFDCDKDPKNGCEAATDSDPANCGGCGMACPKGQLCIGAVCVASPPAMAAWHLDENGGGNFTDASGNGHSGSTNGTSWAPGINGSGLSFSNAGTAQMQGPYLFSQTNKMTIEGWIYMRRQTNSYQGLVSGNGCCNYRLMVSPTMHPYFNPGERRDRPVNGFTFNIGQWYHLAMTIDGGVINIYVDGNIVDTENRDAGPNLPDQRDVFLLGAGESPGLYVPDGIVDEVAIYDKALDQATLQNHIKNPGKF